MRRRLVVLALGLVVLLAGFIPSAAHPVEAACKIGSNKTVSIWPSTDSPQGSWTFHPAAYGGIGITMKETACPDVPTHLRLNLSSQAPNLQGDWTASRIVSVAVYNQNNMFVWGGGNMVFWSWSSDGIFTADWTAQQGYTYEIAALSHAPHCTYECTIPPYNGGQLQAEYIYQDGNGYIVDLQHPYYLYAN